MLFVALCLSYSQGADRKQSASSFTRFGFRLYVVNCIIKLSRAKKIIRTPELARLAKLNS